MARSIITTGALFVLVSSLRTLLSEIKLFSHFDSTSVGESQSVKLAVAKSSKDVSNIEKVWQSQSDELTVAQSSEDSLDIVKLSIKFQEESDISAAVCLETLLGTIDIGLVIQWVAYNRLLGFDHIFMFYRPEVMSHPRFAELQSLPYVTLNEFKRGDQYSHKKQRRMERMCLRMKKFAGRYDWAMLADIDEYLWFSEYHGVKDFLRKYQNMTYLSLGKQMYTLDDRSDMALLDHKLDSNREGFAVSRYPFYMQYYCHNSRNLGSPNCPTWRGRSKVIIRPRHHKYRNAHGYIDQPNAEKGSIHLHPSQAHLMEWVDLHTKHNFTLRHPTNFIVKHQEEVHIHNLQPTFKIIDQKGNYLVKHNEHLQEWFDYVVSRGISQNATLPTQMTSKKEAR